MNMNTLEATIMTEAQTGQASNARNIIFAYEKRNTGNDSVPAMIAKGLIMRDALSKGFSMPHPNDMKGFAQ